MNEQQTNNFILANNVAEAISSLKELGAGAIPVAGATWVMRAPIRQESIDYTFVSLSGIEELKQIEITDRDVSIGSMVTHVMLAQAIKSHPALWGLWKAASWCANPAIRSVATIGGNICATGFFSPDIVPSLVSLEASVEVENPEGREKLSLVDYIKTSESRDQAELVCKIMVPISNRISTHVRLTFRKAGDYPIANLSAAVKLSQDHTIKSVTIGVGSVENSVVRWFNLEAALVGKKLDETKIKSLAADHLDDFEPRDGTDAPGWYRLRVLPNLAGQAFEDLKLQFKRGL